MKLIEQTKQKSKNFLEGLLGNTFCLAIQTHGSHWNVKDPNFYALHNFFEEQYKALYEVADEIAERILSLGFEAPASIKDFASKASLKNYKSESNAKTLIKHLIESHEIIEAQLREIIKAIEEDGDEGTVDFCIARLQEHEKMLWMLKSHL